jgi:pimeloyl-ACP methyl ester carboxylesterase
LIVLLHGFTDSWRTWDLVRPLLEREHEVLAVRLAGHHGGPPLVGTDLVGPVEAELDARGWETAHLVGNSLGGYLALRLAERGRARTVVALAPAGGADHSAVLALQERGAILPVAAHPERVPAELLTPAPCPGRQTLVDNARAEGWPLDPARVTCPLRFVWGTEDRLLPWPEAAARYRGWFPTADWVELEDVGHAPQLDAPLETAQLILGVTGW